MVTILSVYPSCLCLFSFCFWGKYSNSWIWKSAETASSDKDILFKVKFQRIYVPGEDLVQQRPTPLPIWRQLLVFIVQGFSGSHRKLVFVLWGPAVSLPNKSWTHKSYRRQLRERKRTYRWQNPRLKLALLLKCPEPEFVNVDKEPRNRFQGIDSTSLCSPGGPVW